jgi:hypothetical protein
VPWRTCYNMDERLWFVARLRFLQQQARFVRFLE